MLGSLVAVMSPPGSWHEGCFDEHPDLDVKLDAVFTGPGGDGVHVVSLRGADAERAYQPLRQRTGPDAFQLMYREGGRVQVRITVPGCPIADALWRSGVVPNYPAPLVDNEYRLFVVGQEGQLTTFMDRLTRNGIEARLVRRVPLLDGVQDLTHYQYEVLRRALQEGYYDRPRRATLTELAQRVGVAKSTLSETLRAVERKVVLRRLHGRFPPGTLRRVSSDGAASASQAESQGGADGPTVKNRDK